MRRFPIWGALCTLIAFVVISVAETSAQARPAQRTAALSGPCTGVLLKTDFVGGQYCKNGQQYAAFLALPGATFTRASIKTCATSAGVMVQAASGVPCITDLGLLVEESRTNLALWSQDTSQSAWNLSPNSPTKTAAVGVAPDGTTTANRIARTSIQASYIQQPLSKAASALTYSMTFYVKQGSARYASIRLQGTFPARVDAQVDLQTGLFSLSPVPTAFTAVSGAVTNAADGWYRVTLSATSDAGTILQTVISPSNVSGNQIDSTDTLASGSIDWWGAQLEQAGISTSYIPTTSAATTRAADVATMTGLLALSSGTVIVRALGSPSVGTNPRLVGQSGTTVALAYTQGNNGGTYNGATALLTSTAPITPGAPFRLATSWDATGRSVGVNGAAAVTDANSMAAATAISIGSQNQTGDNYWDQYIQGITIMSSRLSNAAMQGLTQ